MGFLPAALAVASTLVEGFSGFQQAKYQQAVARNNEQIALDNADRTAAAAQLTQLRSDREYAAQMGEQFAMQGASGLDVLGRSQMMIRENLHRVRGEAAMDIRRQGEVDTRNFQQEAANFAGEASAAKRQAIWGLIGTGLKIGNIAYQNKDSLIGGSKSTKKSTS